MKYMIGLILLAFTLGCTKIKTRDVASSKDFRKSEESDFSKECLNDICVGDLVLAIEPLRVIGIDFYKEAEILGFDSNQNFTIKFLKDERIVTGVFQEDISFQEGCLKPNICVGQSVYVLDEAFENAQEVTIASITSSKRSVTVFNPKKPIEIFYVSKNNVFTKDEFQLLSNSRKTLTENLTITNE